MAEQQGEAQRVVRLASIVSVDIVGFSTMSERDQQKAARKVEGLRARIERLAAAHGGRLFNTAGDGFMLEFASAGSALGAIQELLDRPAKGEPPVRVGAHVGDVVVTDTNDLLGHGVNVAARLQALADPGAALVSSEFRSMARSSPTAAFQSKGQKPLDNIEQRVQTFEILSRRQKLARLMRRIVWGAVVVAIIAVLVYFSPVVWRLYQNMSAPPQVAPPPTAPAALSQAAPSAPTLAPGQVIHDCANCPEMLVLSGGLFVMGSPANEPGRGRDEGPQHEVSIAPFAMSKTEITFALWDACLAGGGCNGYSPPDHGWGRGAQPVTDVSWEDAHAYLDWLNAQAGEMRYRLPTEAEWEYAARAGEAGPYASGARLSTAQATFGARRTSQVGAHDANVFGLFDMNGNVGEWVEDCYAANYELAPIDGAAVQADDCSRRVYRGGMFTDRAAALRSAARKSAAPGQRLQGVGLRVVRILG